MIFKQRARVVEMLQARTTSIRHCCDDGRNLVGVTEDMSPHFFS